MRGWLVVLALVVACKGSKNKNADKPAPSATQATATVTVPKVAVASVLAKEERRPPFFLLVDEQGKHQLAAAASWTDVDTKDLRRTAKTAPLDMLDRFTREVMGLGQDPVEALANLDTSDVAIALDVPSPEKPGTDLDDPPPPEEEDKPEDGADESGGTGTAMALEEGKMGKKDSDRAEGQYKMQKNQEDPQLARQQALERERAEMFAAASRPSYDGKPNDDGTPARVATALGGVMPDGRLERLKMIVLAAPSLKATKLIDLVAQTGAGIGVSHAGRIRPLRIDFELRDGTRSMPYWLEVRVAANGPIVVEAVPDKPIEIAKLDELAGALDKARTARGADAESNVDVLVDPTIDTQRLVDVLVALDQANVRIIGMGAMPNAEETARRGKRIPTTAIGQPLSQGDLDKAEIRKVVKANKAKLQGCYDKALAGEPTLAGTVQVQFFISPKGTVASASASGVDPALASCVAAAVKSLVFPAPKGGGGVQVNYPFTFRP